MSNKLEELNKYIKKNFNFSLNDIPIPKTKLYPISTKQGGLLIGTRNAVKHPYLTGGIDCFSNRNWKHSPYFLIGFWGHGVNSYAFYYVRADKKTKIFFRLPYGGAYMDNEAEAKRIPKFIFDFFEFEKKLNPHLGRLYADESMWSGDYEIILLDQAVKYKRSIYHSTDQFTKILEYLGID